MGTTMLEVLQQDTKIGLIDYFFITAYQQFKQHIITRNENDYLLQPIDPKMMENVFQKFDNHANQSASSDHINAFQKLLETFSKKEYKKRFLVKTGKQFTHLNIADIAYFYSEDKLVFACDKNGKRHHLDYYLDQLEEVLNPNDFFRINRKFIISVTAIDKIHTYFNSRLKLELKPITKLETVVSRDRVGSFKKWLDK